MYTRTKPKSKPTRIAPHHGERFAKGLTPPSRPTYRAPADLADLEWAAREFTLEPVWDLDTVLDQRAVEAEALDRLERGLIPNDTAEMIARTRI